MNATVKLLYIIIVFWFSRVQDCVQIVQCWKLCIKIYMKIKTEKVKTLSVCERKFKQNLSKIYSSICILFFFKSTVLHEMYSETSEVTNNFVHLLYLCSCCKIFLNKTIQVLVKFTTEPFMLNIPVKTMFDIRLELIMIQFSIIN